MGRKKDSSTWEHFEQINGISKCKYCEAEFKGNPSAKRLRNHLLGGEGGGIRSCSKVPDDVKIALRDASTSSKRPRIEPPSPINNNDFYNQGQRDNEQQMREKLQRIQDFLEGSYTGKLLEIMAVTENNSASTFAPQQNNDSQNQMQADQLVVQGTDQECSIMPESSGYGKPFPTKNLVGEAFKTKKRGKKDEHVWSQFEKKNDGITKCKHCGLEFRGKPSATRLRDHLLGVQGRGIISCTQVPDQVKNALADAWHQSIPNDHLRCNDVIEKMLFQSVSGEIDLAETCEVLPAETEKFIQSKMDEFRHRTEPSSSNNEVTSPNSTSAPQDNNNSENLVQDGERMQPAVQEQPLSEKEARSDHKLSDDSSNPADPGSKEEKEREMSRTKDEICMQVPDHVNKPLADDSRKRSPFGFSSSNNEVNNSISTSAPQENNEFSNQVQDGEMMQLLVRGTNQHCFSDAEMIEKNEEMNSELFPTMKLVGQSFKAYVDIVWEWLLSDEVSTIGIHGMGGVGKTTLAMYIRDMILKNSGIFDHVYWITISQDISIERLQDLIAETFGFDLQFEENVRRRAARLFKELSRKQKFVLILDDLWDYFDLELVGIPLELNGCKLIVTSRSLTVCTRTNCQKIVKVLPLLQNEAWELFMRTLGNDLAPHEVPIARSKVEECAGLPLGIVTVAGSMRKPDGIQEWNKVLTNLQNSEVREDDMEAKVFRALRDSYLRLNEPQLQQCLLYCALYPEDFKINRDELIQHLIVEGLIQRTYSRRAAFDRGHTILNKLVNVSLLESMDGGFVKMHNLIRDMAMQIMNKSSPSLVEAGKQLTFLPEKRWSEDIIRVSLMNNDIKEFSSHSPRCPNLSTLLLCRNYGLKSMAECFFYQLHGLKVLNLSETAIERLPESVADLENLTALILRKCWNLSDIPSLAKLVALQELDLFDCRKVEEVPEGLESLPNLNYINLSLTGIQKLPAGILTERFPIRLLSFEIELVHRTPSQRFPQRSKRT